MLAYFRVKSLNLVALPTVDVKSSIKAAFITKLIVN
jgi:hypothetical protein